MASSSDKPHDFPLCGIDAMFHCKVVLSMVRTEPHSVYCSGYYPYRDIGKFCATFKPIPGTLLLLNARGIISRVRVCPSKYLGAGTGTVTTIIYLP